MRIQDTQLKRFIIDAGLVSKKDLAAAEHSANEDDCSLSEALISGGFLTEDDMRRIESYVLGIPFVTLKGQKIEFAVLSLIPEPIARNHNIVAFRKHDDALEVAMLDTSDLRAIDFVKKKVGLKIMPRLTDTESVREILRQYQKNLKDVFGDIIMKEAAALKESKDSEVALKKIAEDPAVVRIVDTLLRHAIMQGASDIHIEPMAEQVLIRYRIDGMLHDAMTLPKHAASAIAMRLKLLSKLQPDQKLPQDGRFKMEMDGQKVSFRVSSLPVHFGEKIVMRLLRENRSGFNLEGVGFHGESLERMHHALRQKSGIVLIAGPSGSGKTTTLYTALDLLNTPEVNISTIEDPIEYQMPRINQTQIKSDIGFTFATGLRSLMRQDPDIIMIGEIRDEETAALSINAALTGHLVLSAVPTDRAAAAILRVLDMGVEPFLLTSTLKVVVGQRLVRKLEKKHCEPSTLSSSERAEISKHADLDRVLEILKEERIVAKDATWNSIEFYRPREDAESETYNGRVGIQEVLPISDGVRELVAQNATATDIEALARKEGMLTLLEDGLYKAAQGITSIEEVLRVVEE